MSKLRINELESIDTGDVGTVSDIVKLPGELSANPSTGGGALRVSGAVVYANTIADLQAIDTSGLVDGQEANVAGSVFFWNSSSSNWDLVGDLYVEAFGVYPDGVDHTPEYNQIASYVQDGMTVKWGSQEKYYGDFSLTDVSITCDVNGATLVPSATGSAIRMEASSGDTYNVVETELLSGSNQFTLNQEVAISPGAFILLWDGAMRSTGGEVNKEIVEVQDAVITAGQTTVTVVDRLWAHKGFSSITAELFPSPLINPCVKNAKVENENSSTSPMVFIIGAKCPAQKNITVVGSIGHASRFQECIGAIHYNIRTIDPLQVSSGQGYGATVVYCKDTSSSELYGRATRHTYDASSTYGLNIVKNVRTDDAKSATLVFSHNGFGGSFLIENVRYNTTDYGLYGVSSSSQGYGDATRENHPLHNVTIRDVHGYHSGSAAGGNHIAVYSNVNSESILIENVSIEYKDKALNTSSDSLTCAVRLRGRNKTATIRSVYSESSSRFLAVENIGGPESIGMLYVSGLSFQHSNAPALISGYNVNISDVSYGEVTTEDFLFDIRDSLSRGAYTVYLTNLQLMYTPKPVKSPASNTDSVLLFGEMSLNGMSISASLSISNGGTFSHRDLYSRGKLVRVDSSTTGSTITVNMPDPILTNGEELYLTVPLGRDTISIPASNNSNAFTVADGEVARIISVSGKWTKF